jgi:two-component system LytT family response regulator
MFSTLIVDDNLIERDALSLHLSKIPNIKIIAECQNALEVISFLERHTIDILISDINMPDLSGISLLKSMKNPPVCIFVSSYPEYAADSYDLDVIDYIVKPASYSRVLKAIEKATEYITLKRGAKNNTEPTSLSGITEEIGAQISTDHFFFIKENNGYTKLNLADILYIESMGDFSRFHTITQKKYVVLVGLKHIEKQLSPKLFRRIHKQYMINVLHVTTINGTEIILADKTSIPFSHAFRQNLIETMIEKKLLKRS